MRSAIAAVLLFAAPALALAKPGKAAPPPPPAEAPFVEEGGGGGGGSPGVETEEKGFRLQVEAEFAGMKRSADFIVQNAAQSNHVVGGTQSFPVETKAGKGVEFKKWGFIFNSLAVEDPNDPKRVVVQIQAELSGPVAGDGSVDVQTWQLQTEVALRKGKPKTVSRGTGRLVVTVSDEPED